MWSHVHKYPAQQRFYTITSNNGSGDRPGVDVVHTPTSDGVDVGIEGTLYFTLNVDHGVLRTFDDKYGTRKFRGLDGSARFAWEGDDGWSGFLDQVVRPVIDNDLREQINSFRCAELVSSCVLVQNGGSQQKVNANGQSNNGNIAKVQQAINSSLSADLTPDARRRLHHGHPLQPGAHHSARQGPERGERRPGRLRPGDPGAGEGPAGEGRRTG